MNGPQNENSERGLWYEKPLGRVRGFLKEPERHHVDPDQAEERAAIQEEGRTGEKKGLNSA